MSLRIAFSIFVSFFGAPLHAEQPPVTSTQIATGKPLWVESKPDDALLNARVDIGSMRQNNDEIEFSLQWPLSPGLSERSAIQGARVAGSTGKHHQ